MEISQKIVDYAIWYYLRYYPSVKKMRRKLIEKFGPDSEKWKKYWGIDDEYIDNLFENKLQNIVQEYEVCRAKIASYKQKNKNVNYIRSNLSQKLFDRDMIDEILETEYEISENTILWQDKLRKKVLQLQKKGKSILSVKMALIERPQDKELVEWLIDEVFAEWEFENLKKVYEKLLDKKLEKQKIIQRLMGKWFKYDDIKRLF